MMFTLCSNQHSAQGSFCVGRLCHAPQSEKNPQTTLLEDVHYGSKQKALLPDESFFTAVLSYDKTSLFSISSSEFKMKLDVSSEKKNREREHRKFIVQAN